MLSRLIFIFILISELSFGQDSQLSYKEHCATDDEKKLHSLINEYRVNHQIEPLEFSICLSYVARTHAMDLKKHRPDFGGCNLHSWSDKGKWTPCCYAKDEKRLTCMTQKPREITSYRYKAYEVVYSSTEGTSSEDAFEFWKGITLMNDYLLNTGKWEKPWQALGVGIYSEYICVWFGEGIDQEGSVKDCSLSTMDSSENLITREQQINNVVSDSFAMQSTETKDGSTTTKVKEELGSIEENSANRSDTIKQKLPELTSKPLDDSLLYFIIVASTTTAEQAIEEVNKLKGQGNINAKYLPTRTFFRIAINKYMEESVAYRALAEVKKKYPDAWLLKPTNLNN